MYFIYHAGSAVFPLCPINRSALRRMGTQTVSAANSDIHLRTTSVDEVQPYVCSINIIP